MTWKGQFFVLPWGPHPTLHRYETKVSDIQSTTAIVFCFHPKPTNGFKQAPTSTEVTDNTPRVTNNREDFNLMPFLYISKQDLEMYIQFFNRCRYLRATTCNKTGCRLIQPHLGTFFGDCSKLSRMFIYAEESLWELTCSSGGLAAASGWAINPKFSTKNGSQKEAELWNFSSQCGGRRCLFGPIMIIHFDQALKNKWYHVQRVNYWYYKSSVCPAFFLLKD